jgi:predicted phage terminase large subunit-like protein
MAKQDTAILQKELAARILARRRLLHFILRFQPGYMPGWVHEDICRRLERFKQAVIDKKSPRLLLFCPPRLGKSAIASRHFSSWFLGECPWAEIIAASYNITLPIGFSRQIRETMRDPAYQAMFPECRLSEESQAVESWRTTKGGGYTAAGVGTGITGKGAHVFVVDDPIKDWVEASSAQVRESTWEWWLSTAYTRIAPGGGVLGIQTRWNDDDWAGRIQVAMTTGEGEQYEIVSYPAVNERGDEYILADDTIAQIAPGEPVPDGARLTRLQHTALHPDRYDLEYLMRVKKNFYALGNRMMWEALYQQNPVPDEGAFFRRDMFKFLKHMPQLANVQLYQAWDFAITTKQTSDWIVGVCIMQDEFDNLYELDMVRFKADDDLVIADAIIDFWNKWKDQGLYVVGFEDGQIFKSLKSSILRRCDERHTMLNYETLTPFTDKMVRAGPLRGRMQMGKFYFQENATFRSTVDAELLRFPAGKHDDIVDAYAWATRLSLEHAAPRKIESPAVKSWKDKLADAAGTGASHMAA